METPSLNQIKKTENQANDLIAAARKRVDEQLRETERQGSIALDRAEEKIQPKIEDILTEVKRRIQLLKVQAQRHADTARRQLDEVDERQIDRVAEWVLKEIKK